jgi:pyruvate dehydrogenase complex dehydrogenase (E1) component
MKIYLVRLKNTNVRWFDNEQDLTNFFINAPQRLDSYQVTILNAEVDTEMTGDKLFDVIQEQSNLDRKLNVVLGNEYADKVEKLIQLYEQFCKRNPWDKIKMTSNAQKVYEKLTTTPPEEKQFSKLMSSSCQRYLLYSVSDSVEWYEAMLDVYPKIKSLAETCEIEYVDPVTRGTSWRGGRTPVKMVKNFEKAKKIK